MKRSHLLLSIVGVAALMLFPVGITNPYYIHLVETIMIYAIVLFGLDIVVGYTGQVSLGHAGLFGIGSYTAGVLVMKLAAPLWITLPAAVLVTAGFGALLTLYIFKIDLSIYAFVGLIMLIGIVKKNAIMQIDFALEAERKDGMAPRDAIYRGCLIRFRPIMMTTMAALLGGLAFSQLMTLYLTPVVYTYMAAALGKWNTWKARKAGRKSLTPVMQAGD